MAKKESKDPLVNKIIALRDKLSTTEKKKEDANMACVGMYKCSKLADKPCLDKILGNLEKLANGEAVKLPKAPPAKKATAKKSTTKKTKKG